MRFLPCFPYVTLSLTLALCCSLPVFAQAEPTATENPTAVSTGDKTTAESPAATSAKPAAAQLPQLIVENEQVSINARWPELKNTRIDTESANFVQALAQAFEEDVQQEAKDFAAEKAAGNDYTPHFPYELTVDYTMTEPGKRAVSIVWTVWRFTGGAHGMIDLVGNSYDLEKSVPLLLEDLFIDPVQAINIFSRVSREKLSEPGDESGEDYVDDMVRAGTEPLQENFQTFSLIPNGIRIHFQPYQVAPWAAGLKEVDISLADLEKAQPRPEFWR